MPHLRLSRADQERLGCPDLIPLDLRGITNREAIELAKLGYATPNIFRRALPHSGDELDIRAWTGAVWMGLHRVGVDVDIHTFEFSVDDLEYVPDPEPEPVEESGKAAAREGSTNSTTTSSTSGATSKAKSKTT